MKVPHSHLAVIVPHHLRSPVISFSSQSLAVLARLYNNLFCPNLLCHRHSSASTTDHHPLQPIALQLLGLFCYTERRSWGLSSSKRRWKNKREILTKPSFSKFQWDLREKWKLQPFTGNSKSPFSQKGNSSPFFILLKTTTKDRIF